MANKFLKLNIPPYDVEEIVKEFHLDILATEKVAFSCSPAALFGLNPNKITNPEYLKINFPPETYILTAPEIIEISSYPHLVGKELEKRCLRVGYYTARAIVHLWSLSPKNTLLYDILRAGPGYKIQEGFQKLGLSFPKIKVRPHYKKPSYRRHNAYAGQLEVLYKDFDNLPLHRELTVIKPDTEASGGTSKIAIETLIKEAEKRKSKIKEIIFTGYISAPSINVLQSLAEKYDFQCKILAWGNLTALYYNQYDMPLYGLDEAAWREKGKLRKLGAIVPREVLEQYLSHFPPGADQPGDWSARQSYLDTGQNIEAGDIKGHLEHSLEFLSNLYRLSQKQDWFKSWQEKIFIKEIESLNKEIERYS